MMECTNNTLEIFKNDEFGEIRTIVIDGEPWFVGKDIVDALGYQNMNRDIVAHVDEDDRLMFNGERGCKKSPIKMRG